MRWWLGVIFGFPLLLIALACVELERCLNPYDDELDDPASLR